MAGSKACPTRTRSTEFVPTDWYNHDVRDGSIGSASSAEEALYRRWTRRIWSNRNWVRLYWPTGVGVVLCLFVWLDELRFRQDMFRLLLFVVMSAVRFQIISIAPSLSLPDFRPDRWSLLSVAGAKREDITRAVLRFAFWYSVLPFVALTLAEILVIPETRPWVSERHTALGLALAFVAFLAHGFLLSGLAHRGGQRMGSLLGAFLYAGVPWILSVALGIAFRSEPRLATVLGAFGFPELYSERFWATPWSLVYPILVFGCASFFPWAFFDSRVYRELGRPRNGDLRREDEQGWFSERV